MFSFPYSRSSSYLRAMKLFKHSIYNIKVKLLLFFFCGFTDNGFCFYPPIHVSPDQKTINHRSSSEYKNKENVFHFKAVFDSGLSSEVVEQLVEYNQQIITEVQEERGCGLIDFRDYFKSRDDGLKAWETAIKHVNVRTNVTALTKIDNIAASGWVSISKLKAAIDGDILNAANASDLGKILDRLNLSHVDVTHFDEILARFKKYPNEVKAELINNPNQFEFFDEVLRAPEHYREQALLGEITTSSGLYQWALGKYRKMIFDNAGKLEEFVSNNIGLYVPIPSGYKIAKQVHLKGIKRTIPDDFIYSTMVQIDASGKSFYKAIIHDTKLHGGVDWTPNQFDEIIKKFEEGADYIDLELRSQVIGLTIEDNIRIYKSDVYKSIGTSDKTGTYLSTNKVF
jgi:hypothetical protein